MNVLHPIAKSRSTSIASVALARMLHQKNVTSLIIGANKMSRLSDNLKSLDIKFTEAELDLMNEVSKLSPEYPGSVVEAISGDRR